MGSIYNNPELEMIAKEIQAMLSEKLQIEKEVQDTEYNISVKNTEAHNLQVSCQGCRFVAGLLIEQI